MIGYGERNFLTHLPVLVAEREWIGRVASERCTRDHDSQCAGRRIQLRVGIIGKPVPVPIGMELAHGYAAKSRGPFSFREARLFTDGAVASEQSAIARDRFRLGAVGCMRVQRTRFAAEGVILRK